MTAQLRELIHRWQPDLRESIKWNCLCFSGHKLVLGLSPCKKHLGVVFFRGVELEDPAGLFDPAGQDNLSIRTIKLTNPTALPIDHIRSLLRTAVLLDADPIRVAPLPKKRPPLPIPPVLLDAFKKNAAARRGFDALSPSCQREYSVWIGQAKQEDTIQRRLSETMHALSLGKKWIDRKKLR